MKIRPALTLLFMLVLGVATGGGVAAAQPPAPTPVAPANGTNIQEPFTVSWFAVSDPSGIVAYNWQVSPSSTFSPVILQNSTNGQTQDVVSGLATGTYFWRVQAVNGAFVQGAWSQTSNFTVTGVGSGAPGTPTLGLPKGYSTFHPYEVMTFNWAAVPGAATYVLQASTDSNFPVLTRIQFDNIPNTVPNATFSFAIGNPEGNYWARVFAVNANGIASAPSNLITFSVFFNNPVPPPPSLISPANGTTLTLPVTFTWTDVPNPQPSGYELQVATDSGFKNLEFFYNQITPPTETVTSLATSGQKFWRVRSAQGNASLTTAAVTAWSQTGTFTVSSAAPTPVSVTMATNPLASGDSTWVAVQLTAAVPAGGAPINLISSNPAAAPVPAAITMPGNIAWTQFMMQAGQVTSPALVTITATLNSGSASGQLTVQPTSLKSLSITPSTISGGAQAGAVVMLTGQAPAGGAAVSLSSNSPAVSPPPSVFIAPGNFSVSFPLQTNSVTANTTATITASMNGVTVQSQQLTVTPAAQPTALTLSPATAVGGGPGSVSGTVTIASAASFDQFLQVTSNNPVVLPFLSGSVMVPAGSTRGSIMILPAVVSVTTVVTISVSGSGPPVSADLTVTPVNTPPPPATLSSFSVSPTSVAGGNPSTGTVALPSAAPSGGTVVTLGSNQPGAASVPPSVTVAAGATSASFTVTTFPNAGTTVQLSASLGDSILFAAIGVNPAAPAPALSAVTVSPTTVTGGVSSTGTVTLSAGAPSGGTVVTLSDNSTAATTPASVTVPSGATSASFTITTTSVTASMTATISAAFNGVTRTVTLTVRPPALSAIKLSPSSVVGGTGSQGTATLNAAAPPGGAVVTLTSSNAALAGAPASVTVAAGATSATFAISTSAVTTSASATISGAYGGATRTATLGVTAPASLSAISVNPASVGGGTTSQGTISLTAAAPSGGFGVTLASNVGAATAPASVTVAAGATSATFTIATTSVTASTVATITASAGSVVRTAALTVTPPGQTATLTVSAAGRSGERVTSTPVGINVSVPNTGSASFTTGTSITLTVSNGREAIWTGACSSGGNKAKTCTFTLSGAATVTANVQ